MNKTICERGSGLQELRQLIPNRRTSFAESLRIAEVQAARLLKATTIDHPPVPDAVITERPRIVVEYVPNLPSFGLSFWSGRSWIIQLSTRQSHARQRFTLFHEYKHIIDHGARDRLYLGDHRRSSTDQAELAADYFAGCALVPRRLLKQAWANELIQRPADLARYFDVSAQAIEVRLDQTAIREQLPRCLPGSGSWRLRPHLPGGRAA